MTSLFMLLDNRLRQSLGLDNDEPSSCFAAGVALSPFISDHRYRERHSCQVRAAGRKVTVAVQENRQKEKILSRVVKKEGHGGKGLTVMPSL